MNDTIVIILIQMLILIITTQECRAYCNEIVTMTRFLYFLKLQQLPTTTTLQLDLGLPSVIILITYTSIGYLVGVFQVVV